MVHHRQTQVCGGVEFGVSMRVRTRLLMRTRPAFEEKRIESIVRQYRFTVPTQIFRGVIHTHTNT
eukprot:19414-Eustigmatos_ZCMA.PRE.1